jgi:methionyl-tRNA formyltransferase
VALLEAVVKADAGPVYLRDNIELDGTELLPDLREKQGDKTVEMVIAFLKRWPDIKPEPQQGEPTYYRRRGPEDDRLDVEAPLGVLFDRLRVVDNEKYPAWFEHQGRRYRLAIHPMPVGSAAEEEKT